MTYISSLPDASQGRTAIAATHKIHGKRLLHSVPALFRHIKRPGIPYGTPGFFCRTQVFLEDALSHHSLSDALEAGDVGARHQVVA